MNNTAPTANLECTFASFCACDQGVPGASLEADDVLLAGVRARDLDSVVDRLRARVGEEEARELGGADLQQAVQQRRLHTRFSVIRPPAGCLAAECAQSATGPDHWRRRREDVLLWVDDARRLVLDGFNHLGVAVPRRHYADACRHTTLTQWLRPLRQVGSSSSTQGPPAPMSRCFWPSVVQM